jgi:hypothetical protein
VRVEITMVVGFIFVFVVLVLGGGERNWVDEGRDFEDVGSIGGGAFQDIDQTIFETEAVGDHQVGFLQEGKLNHGKTNPDNSTQGMIILEETQANLNKLKVNAGYANGAWSGTVYDEQGHGLPGANIMVSGTPAGTVSDLDGSFKIESDQTDELYISFVGYETVKLAGK